MSRCLQPLRSWTQPLQPRAVRGEGSETPERCSLGVHVVDLDDPPETAIPENHTSLQRGVVSGLTNFGLNAR